MSPMGKNGRKGVREFDVDIYALLYLKWINNRTYCIAHGILPKIMWQCRWGGELFRGE